jgi:hypothetical protein
MFCAECFAAAPHICRGVEKQEEDPAKDSTKESAKDPAKAILRPLTVAHALAGGAVLCSQAACTGSMHVWQVLSHSAPASFTAH